MHEVKHLVDTRQCKDEKFLRELFKKADRFLYLVKRREVIEDHRGKILTCFFTEPSTRTKLSFEAAALRLGASVSGSEHAGKFSSLVKGETIEHSILATMEDYDAIVIRHSEPGTALRAARVSPKPVINAGDGNNQHPTQALLDAYTIRSEFDRTHGLKVAMVGDLRNGRTVRSLAYLLAHLDNNELFFVSPSAVSMGDDILKYLEEKKVKFHVSDSLEPLLPEVDVLYVTRVQKERFSEGSSQYKEIVENYDKYRVTRERADMMHDKSIIMHPLPIDTAGGKPEIAPEVDNHPRARYFSQSAYGVYVRMAILDTLFKGEGDKAYDLLLDPPSLT